jgi:uncharacterized protein YhdP
LSRARQEAGELLTGQQAEQQANGRAGITRVEWGGVDLKVGALDIFRRRFSDLAFYSTFAGGAWRSNLVGKELEGTASWQPQGQGRIVARMKTLIIPAAAPAVVQSRSCLTCRGPIT